MPNHDESFENQMTNGSSFNYADQNDSVHDHLDVELPKTQAPEIRDDVNWGSPDKKPYDYNSDNEQDDYSVWKESGTNIK